MLRHQAVPPALGRAWVPWVGSDLGPGPPAPGVLLCQLHAVAAAAGGLARHWALRADSPPPRCDPGQRAAWGRLSPAGRGSPYLGLSYEKEPFWMHLLPEARPGDGRVDTTGSPAGVWCPVQAESAVYNPAGRNWANIVSPSPHPCDLQPGWNSRCANRWR